MNHSLFRKDIQHETKKDDDHDRGQNKSDKDDNDWSRTIHFSEKKLSYID